MTFFGAVIRHVSSAPPKSDDTTPGLRPSTVLSHVQWLYVLEQQLRPLAVRHGHDIDVWLHCRVRLRHTPTILHCIQKLILKYSKVVVIVKSFIIFVAHREALISVNLLQLDTWVRPWDHGYSATASCGVDCLLCTYCWCWL